MYRLSIPDFLELISKGLKKPIKQEEVFSNEIKLDYVKRIDKIFEKGLHYYLNPSSPERSKEASVFFRKEHFATDNLTLGAIKTVDRFENLKHSLSAIAKLSGLDLKRNFKKYSITNKPQKIAEIAREKLYPQFSDKKRDFLKQLIDRFATENILVCEFIETWNKKDRANIDGFFLKPNMIVLKRHQSFRREIFTIAHELGHYLLEEEEIEELDYKTIGNRKLSKMERWCNDFAYYFLIGKYAESMELSEKASVKNDYCHNLIKEISKKTHLSERALFTRLLFDKKISEDDYSNVISAFDKSFREKQEEQKKEKQRLKEQGVKQRGTAPKPILSPLFISTIQTAFYEGVLNEYEVCQKLKIKNPKELDKYIP